jgi:hypothetical protein
MKKALAVLGVIALAVVALNASPKRRVISPPWRVEVVDEAGAPVPGVVVTQEWRHFSAQRASSSTALVTDAAGVVQYPERTIEASNLTLALGAVRNFLTSTWHASYGPSAFVVVSKLDARTGVPAGAMKNEVPMVSGVLVWRPVVKR